MELTTHCTVERRAIRMHKMMDRLSVDATALVLSRKGDTYAAARSRCLSCESGKQCLRWLDGGVFSPRDPDFCPILDILDRFRAICPPAMSVNGCLADGQPVGGGITNDQSRVLPNETAMELQHRRVRPR